jgi:uncharacterized sulfatase
VTSTIFGYRSQPVNRISALAAMLVVFTILNNASAGANAGPRPNIVWISAEDISPHLGCYGDPHAITPNLDRLAEAGIRYTRAFTTAGVCAPCRSGIITGMYQTTLGTHHMRCRAKLPDYIKPIPMYLREAGYYTTNNSKEDYQFATPPACWDDSSTRAHWRGRQPNQPFFAVFNFNGCHESGLANEHKYRTVTKHLLPDQRQNAAELTTLPPYYPDTPVTREDWKRNYELITAMDAWAGTLIQQLKDDGLYEDTIIMFWSDHGVGLPRAKRWLYDSGTHIPLIVRIPAKLRGSQYHKPGSVSGDLISSIDFGPTVLKLAGVGVPDYCQGRWFLGDEVPVPRQYVFGARDRMDERYDIIRMVRDTRFKYLRNYEPLKPYFQWMETPEKGATMRELRHAEAVGELPAVAQQYFARNKPAEELYDTESDPHELNNLAEDPQFADVLKRMRAAHLSWVQRTRDLGLIAEPILVDKQQRIGNRYEVLHQQGGLELARRISAAAVAASQSNGLRATIVAAATDSDPAVRYWGAVGLGNLLPRDPELAGLLQRLLEDSAGAVRSAAAHALCRGGHCIEALPVLQEGLANGAQWERLQAAIVLDELDLRAVPVAAAMRSALTPRQKLFAKGKYTVRVMTKALQELPAVADSQP